MCSNCDRFREAFCTWRQQTNTRTQAQKWMRKGGWGELEKETEGVEADRKKEKRKRKREREGDACMC